MSLFFPCPRNLPLYPSLGTGIPWPSSLISCILAQGHIRPVCSDFSFMFCSALCVSSAHPGMADPIGCLSSSHLLHSPPSLLVLPDGTVG